jgi:hypothetical protein
MRTLWPIGSVSDETLLLSLVRSSLAVPQAAERAKTFETNPTHLRYMRAVHARVDRSVTACYNLVDEPGSPVYPPPRRPGLPLALFTRVRGR